MREVATRSNTQTISGLDPQKRYTVRVDDVNFKPESHFINVNGTSLKAHALVDVSDEATLQYTVDLLTVTATSSDNKLLCIYKTKVPDLYGITHIDLGFTSSNNQGQRKIRVYEVI